MPQVPNNVKFGVPLMVVSFIVFSLALWGGAQLIKSDEAAATDGAADGGGGGGGGPVSVTVVARNLQFDKRSLTANAGAPFSVTLDNQDAGVLHNIAFYTSRSATQALVPNQSVGELFAGVASRTLTFTPPRAGSFFFRCDVHPDTMTGTFTVR
ncbi:MAG TPA: cupredoxin domain-containing protein [Dehalococcoidia bacterium]|nr:cupredoxin domain-containing protein [Dehalococcoidia bacterium]